jgi:hypothetical protein
MFTGPAANSRSLGSNSLASTSAVTQRSRSPARCRHAMIADIQRLNHKTTEGQDLLHVSSPNELVPT